MKHYHVMVKLLASVRVYFILQLLVLSSLIPHPHILMATFTSMLFSNKILDWHIVIFELQPKNILLSIAYYCLFILSSVWNAIYGSDKKGAADGRPFFPFWPCHPWAGHHRWSVKWFLLRNMEDSQSRSIRGAHKQFNPDKSLAAVWPIASSLLAFKCSRCWAHAYTCSLPTPLFINRKTVRFVHTCTLVVTNYMRWKTLFASLLVFDILVYCHNNQSVGRQSSAVKNSRLCCHLGGIDNIKKYW